MPIAEGIAAGAQILGTGVSAYGAYKQAQQAQKQYEMAVRAWQDDQARQKRLDEESTQQMGFNNAMSTGQYAGGQMQSIQDPYLAYAKMLGLGG